MDIFVNNKQKNSSVIKSQLDKNNPRIVSNTGVDASFAVSDSNDKSNYVLRQSNNDIFVSSIDSSQQQIILNNLETQYYSLLEEYENTKREQGVIGNFWNGCKNTIGISPEGKSNLNPLKWWGKVCNKDNGSDQIDKQLEELGQNIEDIKVNPDRTLKVCEKISGKKLSSEDIQKISKGEDVLGNSTTAAAVKRFQDGQETAVDCIADLVSGFVSFGGYTLAIAGGIAAPFTGGLSLSLVAAGLGIAAGTGAVSKVAVKGLDAYTGHRTYDSLRYDLIMGGINGVLAPITAGIGGTAGRTVATRLGITAVREGVDLTAEQIAKEGVKSGVLRTLTSTGNTYIGESFLNRNIALATEMAVDGSIGGAIDNSSRHVVQTGSLDGAGKAFAEGAIGGLIMAPVIGGGLRTVGKITKPATEASNIFRRASSDAEMFANNVQEAGESAFVQTIKEIGDDISEKTGVPASIDILYKNSDLIIKNIPEDIDPTIFGIGPCKIAQTIANDKSLSEYLRNYLKKTQSSLPATRTLSEAQQFSDKVYGKGKYIIKGVGENKADPLGVGTIGEVYLATNSKNEEVVIKMIKNGVTEEQLEKEKIGFIKIVEEISKDDNEKQYRTALIEGLYDSWKKEIDFMNEYNGGKALSKNAKGFKVAEPIEVGIKDNKAVSLVLNKAEGVQLDKFTEMMELYKTDQTEFFAKYASDIEKYPWLKDIDSISKKVPEKYLRAQNEQTLILNGNEKTMHGDPHEGNVLLNYKNGELELTYIDTGATITRETKDVINDLSVGIAAITGNTKVIALNLLENAQITSGLTKEEVAEKFAKMLDERLYNAGVDLRNSQYNQNIINSIIKDLGVILDPNDALKFKAAAQTLITYRNLCETTGVSSSMQPTIKDLFIGITKAINNDPVSTLKLMEEVSGYVYKEPEKAVRCFMQMIYK